MNWKIIIPAALLAAVLVLAALAAGPVRRTTFKLAQPGCEELLLASELRDLPGVLGLLLEADGELLVDHEPGIEPLQLARTLTAGGHEATLMESRRILPMHALTFPSEGGRRGCGHSPNQCPAGEAWRALLGR